MKISKIVERNHEVKKEWEPAMPAGQKEYEQLKDVNVLSGFTCRAHRARSELSKSCDSCVFLFFVFLFVTTSICYRVAT